MTEEGWLASDSQLLLRFLRGMASDRKLRLFACADCRRYWFDEVDEASRSSVLIAEKYVDGEASEEELTAANLAAKASPSVAGIITSQASLSEAYSAALEAAWMIMDTAQQGVEIGEVEATWEAENFIQSNLIRDIFPNPFRPITADPAWLTPTVQSIAAAIYRDRAFDRLPILADALEEAGCTNADILLHCRRPGEHVRGCWVVDLVLGKE